MKDTKKEHGGKHSVKLDAKTQCGGWYSEWGMRGWSVLGSVLLMGSGALVWSLLMARWIDSKAYTLFLHWTLKGRQHRPSHDRAG